jgi:hypothetical protein
MADNTAQNGTNTVATDDIGGVHFQRFKPAVGADGTAVDVSAAAPMPIYGPDTTTSATITATDAVVGAPAGAGALLSGASTAGSLVAIACPGGDSAWTVQITGLTSGTLYYEASLDSTNGTDGSWTNVNGRQTGVLNTVLAGSATANGIYRGNTSGIAYFRVRSVGALSGTPTVRIRVSDGPGAVFLNASIPAGSNTIGQTPVVPTTSGGLLISRVISAASTNATSAKASAGQVYGWYLSNVNAAVRYLKLYNKASAPTVGTDTPVMTIAIPGGSTAGAGANVEFTNGIAFGTGIAYALTTGAADSDTAAVAASEIIVNLLYK